MDVTRQPRLAGALTLGGPRTPCATADPRLQVAEGFPADVRSWVPSENLVCWVEQAIAELHWEHPAVIDHLRQNPMPNPRDAFRLLAVCYLAGIYDWETLSRECHSDAALRRICQGPVPFADEFGGFRRRNRRVLQWIMQRVLVRAATERPGLGIGTGRELSSTAEQNADRRLSTARHMQAAG